MSTGNEIGKQFEKDLSEEFGLSVVPGSGNQWHSKLDLKGLGARWSLKATAKESASIRTKDIEEAVRECGSMSGDGAIPIWAFRLGEKRHDIIALRKEDFLLLQKGEVTLVRDVIPDKIKQKRLKIRIPKLMRNE